jgi:hypothetical protein
METLNLSANCAAPPAQSANDMYSSAQACAAGKRSRCTINGVSTTKGEFRLNRKFRLDRAEGVIPSIAGERNFMAPKIPMIFGPTFLLFIAVVYVYMSLALMTIATKTNTANGWLAWIPIANLFLTLNIARKPVWWFILMLIPLVNIVVFILVWMGVAEARQKPNWWGILVIVPLFGLIVPAYLAWSD